MSSERVVVTAIVTSMAGVLLCRRRDASPLWSFPGGELEDGETTAECAIRETAEETGLTIKVDAMLGERIHPKSKRLMLYYAATPVDEYDDLRVKVGDTDEHDEVQWMAWAEAQPLLPHLFGPVHDHLAATLG